MTTRARGPGAGFGWLMDGIRLVFSQPKPFFGGAAWMVAACLLPSLITLPMQFFATKAGVPNTTITIVGMAISIPLGLLIVPLYAGYLQMLDAAQRKQAVRTSDIFELYRQGEALRLIGFGLLTHVIYIAGTAAIVLATGRGLIHWYTQVMASQASHQLPPALPGGLWTTLTLITTFCFLMMGCYAVSLGQVVLNQRRVFSAIGEGLIGALKNVLPLLVLALNFLIASVVLIIVLAIGMMVLALLAQLLGLWLMIVGAILIYAVFFLLMFAGMFGLSYFLWRDVCGGDGEVAMPPPLIA
ncbi:hypothetical protein [Rhodanobacter sp. DHG33]|uniref:hypothetical protein n=1 Tax=Rhodanobacter sp. DHG33 TaxID=2775921 RepID=UPI00177E3FCB|nr:hypothetical protein [Rhodanobacter sp. DHG33]MBD8898998.1 hypothetical protein [Rhodanobacter sp. DHG33]